jgi:putative ABC transport system substrate-binding protein
VASLFCQQFKPEADWDALKERAVQAVFDVVQSHCPNFRASLLGYRALTPLDLEREFGLVGGDIFHGQLSLDQLFSLRPLLGYARYAGRCAGCITAVRARTPGRRHRSAWAQRSSRNQARSGVKRCWNAGGHGTLSRPTNSMRTADRAFSRTNLPAFNSERQASWTGPPAMIQWPAIRSRRIGPPALPPHRCKRFAGSVVPVLGVGVRRRRSVARPPAARCSAACSDEGSSDRFPRLTPGEEATTMKPFLERLRESGYVDGANMSFESRSAQGRPERLPQLAAELVQARPDILVTGGGTLTALAAKAATPNIPIVMTAVGDPVGTGLVASLSRPGGNVTGMSGVVEIGGKQLQLLQELTPGKQTIAVLMNPETPYTRLALKEIHSAAEATRTRIHVLEARTAEQIPHQFDAAASAGAGGLIVIADPLLYSQRRQLSDLSAKAQLPTIYPSRDFAEEGGLISYGPSRRQILRRAAEYVDRILKGAKPADLPVEQQPRSSS